MVVEWRRKMLALMQQWDEEDDQIMSMVLTLMCAVVEEEQDTPRRLYHWKQRFKVKPKMPSKFLTMWPLWDDADVVMRYRVTREVFAYLEERLSHVLEPKRGDHAPPGPTSAPALTVGEQIAIALTYFATGDSYASIADTHNCSRTSVSRVVRRVAKAIYSQLAHEHIVFPREASK